MKAKDLRERSLEDLKELEKSITAEKFQSRLKNFTNRLDNTSLIKKARRDLARIKTILAQKAAGGAEGTVKAATKKVAAKKTAAKKVAPKAAVKSAPKAAASKPAAPKSKPAAPKSKPAKKSEA